MKKLSFGDDLVSLEEAKKLKKDGFNKPTYYYYLDKNFPFLKKGLKRVKLNKIGMNHNAYDEFIYSAPFKTEI